MLVNILSCQEDYYTESNRRYLREIKELTEVPDDMPDDAESVDLGNNRIARLEKDSFRNLSMCNDLVLHGNSISEIEHGAFNGLHRLTDLHLDNNKLKQVNADMFVGLETLKILGFDCNSIGEIKKMGLLGNYNHWVVCL